MLTCGNRKLGDKIYNFNLPRYSCLHKTAACEKYCYARKNFWNAKCVKTSMDRNYDITKSPTFVDVISAQITYLKVKEDIRFIRLHSSGDFYSQEYYEKWNQIAQKQPDMVFLAYTKNYDIDFTNKAPNFRVYNSIDKTTVKENPTLALKAYVIEKNEAVKKHMYRVDKNNSYLCDSKCHSCKFCYISNKNVSFIRR